MHKKARMQIILKEYFGQGKIESQLKFVRAEQIQHLFLLTDRRDNTNVLLKHRGDGLPKEVKHIIDYDGLIATPFHCYGHKAPPYHPFVGKDFTVIDIFRMKDSLFCVHWWFGSVNCSDCQWV